jgi:hypothetical protein
MHRVVLDHLSANEALELKQKLDQAGLSMGQDYEWAYCPSRYDGFYTPRPRHAIFSFRDEATATFFRLKWC